jgi:hypothetical protein
VAEGTHAALDLTIDLNSYLGPQVIEYRVTRLETSGAATTGAWISWDLNRGGNVVSLTWSSIGANA